MNVVIDKMTGFEAVVDFIAYHYNRSNNQCLFLYNLCDKNIERYCTLEDKIKQHFISYCPGDKEEVNKILNYE